MKHYINQDIEYESLPHEVLEGFDYLGPDNESIMFFNSISKIPQFLHGVYLLYFDNSLWYIGQSKDIYHRLSADDHPYCHGMDIWILPIVESDRCIWLEAILINLYHPPRNLQIPQLPELTPDGLGWPSLEAAYPDVLVEELSSVTEGYGIGMGAWYNSDNVVCGVSGKSSSQKFILKTKQGEIKTDNIQGATGSDLQKSALEIISRPRFPGEYHRRKSKPIDSYGSCADCGKMVGTRLYPDNSLPSHHWSRHGPGRLIVLCDDCWLARH